MYRFVLVFLLLCPSILLAQKTKLQVDKYDDYRVEYHVLKSNKYMKQGGYQKFSTDDVLMSSGQYNEGKRDGVWTFYNEQGDTSTVGAYDAGLKKGEWSYYGSTGLIEEVYDFTKRELTYYDPLADTVTETIIVNGERKRVNLSWPAVYKTGEDGMWDDIQNISEYPEEARQKGIVGVVEVTFTVSKQGNIKNVAVTKRAHTLLDDEAIRVIYALPKKWFPAKFEGEPVDVLFKVELSFI